jgi:hypothetical protein
MSVRDQRDTRRDTSVEAESRAMGLNIGWTVFSYMLSGMAAYGAIGWFIGRAVHVSMLFPIGMLVGLAISIGFVIWRFGKSGAPGTSGTTGTSRARPKRTKTTEIKT